MADPLLNNNNDIVPVPGAGAETPEQIRRKGIIAGWAPVPRAQMIETVTEKINLSITQTTLQFLEPVYRTMRDRHLPGPGQSRLFVCRITQILQQSLYALTQDNMMINMRGLYYRLRLMKFTNRHGVEVPLFGSEENSGYAIDAALRHCSVVCECNLQSLAIWAGDKGFITGAASIRIPDGQVIHLNNYKMSIDGDIAAKADLVIFGQFTDGVILVVESEEAFDTLRLGGLCDNRPILMIALRGYASYATRAMLLKIHDLYPTTPILAFNDYNLHGYYIYEHLSGRGLTACRSNLYEPQMPIEVTWFGMNLADATGYVHDNRDDLTQNEIRLINTAIELRERVPADTLPDAPGISENCRELIRMRNGGFKAQITDMQNIGGPSLTDIVAQKIHEHLHPNGPPEDLGSQA